MEQSFPMTQIIGHEAQRIFADAEVIITGGEEHAVTGCFHAPIQLCALDYVPSVPALDPGSRILLVVLAALIGAAFAWDRRL